MTRLALLLAMAPLSGCLLPFFGPGYCGGGECGPAERVQQGAYLVMDQEDAAMIDGAVQIERDMVLITWVDDQGRSWEAEYAVVDRFPKGKQ